MRKLITILFLFISIYLSGATYYVSTTGNDAAAGTIGAPWLTWQKGFATAIAGDTVYIRGGTYHVSGPNGGYYRGVSKNAGIGTAGNPICIFAYPGEVPILDGTTMVANATHNGMYISNSSYYHLKGLTIRYFTEYGKYAGCPLAHAVVLYNCDHMTFELCTAQGCGRGFVLDGTTDYTTFLNCDAFDNEDFADYGGYADGFGANLYGATHACHTTFEGCRSWHNSDDGYDCYASDGSYQGGYVTFNNCWAFWNGYRQGNGAGFKFGQSYSPKESGVQRTVTNCIAFGNLHYGFDESQDIASYMDINLYNNTAYDNGSIGFWFNYTNGGGTITLKNNISYANTNNTSLRSGVVQSNNTWNGGVVVSNADFVSLDDSYADDAREADGSMPSISFFRLAAGSDLIGAGVDVGLTYDANGDSWDSPPSMGTFEFASKSSTAPTVLTAAVTAITDTTATCGGNVTDDGGETVTARGVCWSTSPNPTTALATKTSDGTGTGVYSSSITGLMVGTVYYVRAYATNTEGTDYGEERTFVTSETSPDAEDKLLKLGVKMIIFGNYLIRL